MRLDDERESSNIESQRGGFGLGGGLRLGGGGMSIGVVVLILVASVVFGFDPRAILGGGDTPQAVAPSASGEAAISSETDRLVARVLGSTERRWSDLFAAQSQQYVPATLVFYDGNGMSGCGTAQAAMGPFYCPTDNKIYLDTSFFDELSRRFGAPGDFAMAYVIAHEVGHHIQTITGTADRVRQAQARSSEPEANALQVKMELQADCYAGVWAANDVNLLEPGDVEEGLRAAEAIGDDTLMKAAGRRPVPESFTHGTSALRMEWLKRGLDTGDPAQCDTFG